MRLIDADVLIQKVKEAEDERHLDKGDASSLQFLIDEYAAPVIRCRNCKHFELNHWENVNGIPLIVAHGICTKWGDGCKTSMDGYCFLAERKKE